MKHRSKKRNEGVALILTLLFVVLLTVMVVEFAYEAQVEASYSLNSENEYQVKLAARSAVYKGISVLETDRLAAEFAASSGTANGQVANTNTNTAYNGASPVDSRYSSWARPGTFEPLNDAMMRTTITDEFGKINLNALVYYDGQEKIVREHLRTALEHFFELRATAAGAEADPALLVESIIDWIDEDDESDGDGGESDFYLASENPYTSKNGPMDSIEELLLIKGMSKDLYFGKKGLETPPLPLSEYLTVHGDWLGRINPNTVQIDFEAQTSDVLESMSVGWMESECPLAEIVDYEGIIQYLMSTGDETSVFQSVTDLTGQGLVVIGSVADVVDDQGQGRGQNNTVNNNNQQQQQQQTQAEEDLLRQMFTVYSHIFRIYGDGLMDDTVVRNEVYVLRVPQDDATMDWPQTAAALSCPNPIPSDLVLPEEFYRILEWKVIQ